MKISILIILLLSLTSSSLDSPGWNATYFSSKTVQLQDTWCVHACMEMSFGLPQCESVNVWLSFRNNSLPPSSDCCGVVSPSDRYFCIVDAGVPRSEITRFLSTYYSPIVGRYTTLWDFLSRSQGIAVAYLSLRYSCTYHLAVLLEVHEPVEDYYEIVFCDPAIGKLSQIENTNPLEIVY